VIVTCPDCANQLGVEPGTRLKHNADGSHTVIPPTPPRKATDPKPRGRRRG